MKNQEQQPTRVTVNVDHLATQMFLSCMARPDDTAFHRGVLGTLARLCAGLTHDDLGRAMQALEAAGFVPEFYPGGMIRVYLPPAAEG